MADDKTMTTYKRADGELWQDEYGWVTDLDGYRDDLEDPLEVTEEVWVLQSTRTFTIGPICGACDEPAIFWGLCEKHAREDDPDSFDDEGLIIHLKDGES